jgi:hypothetical protein
VGWREKKSLEFLFCDAFFVDKTSTERRDQRCCDDVGDNALQHPDPLIGEQEQRHGQTLRLQWRDAPMRE